jgi:hypothetical protein
MKTFGCTVDKLVALFDITHFPIYTKLKKVGLKIGYIIPPNLTCFLLYKLIEEYGIFQKVFAV